MSRRATRRAEHRLNEGLCPEDFKICVPKCSKLLGDWECPTRWRRYLRTLDLGKELPHEYQERQDDPPSCWTCDCKEGWELIGDVAIAHACKVHDRIYRQLLSLEHVSAVDVGFAIQEQQSRFRNFLAIRIHVNQKLPPEQLVRVGLTNFTPRQLAFAGPDGRYPAIFSLSTGRPRKSRHRPPRSTRSCDGPNGNCPHPDRWRELVELLREEFEDSKALGQELGRYPISGVHWNDLSIFCAPEEDHCSSNGTHSCCQQKDHESTACEEDEIRSLNDVRLSICGVPIDVINARYEASIGHPGGDAASGVFVDPSKKSAELSNDEGLLIGRGRVNPLVGGVSIGSVTGQAGTLGVVVWDRTDGTPCILSNWHVLAGTPSARFGQPTYQPALFDGGTTDDVVARLKRWQLGEEGDAALAELTGDRHYASGEVIGLWHPVSGNLPPRLNLPVRKWGRTSGFTQGFVDGIHLATNIDYGGGVVRHFRHQFHIAALYEGDDVSQVGDSGSLVVTSFKPLDMQKHLKQLTEWLSHTCDSKEELCKEINNDLECLLKDCPKDCSDPCHNDVCGLLRHAKDYTFATEDCKNLELPKLCEHLNEDKASLNKKCKSASKIFAFLTCIELELEKLLAPCERRRSTGAIPTEEVQRAILCCCSRAYPKELACKQFNAAKEFLTKELQCWSKEIDWKLKKVPCEVLKKALEELQMILKRLETCVRICRRSDRLFGNWIDRVYELQLARELCKLINEKYRKCGNPAKLVDDIAEELPEKLSGLCKDVSQKAEGKESAVGLKETEEDLKDIKRLLHALLHGPTHTPESQAMTQERVAEQRPHPCEKDTDGAKNDERDIKLFVRALRRTAGGYLRRKRDDRNRDDNRVYYAVGMIFAGDTPGSPFGEFAVASDIARLEEELRFSLRPVFEPRSSFRELRVRPPGRGQSGGARGSRRALRPGEQSADPRPGGPQPDIESTDTESGGGG